jgi:cell division protein FtsL
MAVNERTYERSYEYHPLYTGAAAFKPAYPQTESEEFKRVRRTRVRPKAEPEVQTEYAGQGLSLQELRQLIAIAVIVGVLLIGLLVINAYAASLQCSINDLTKANIALEDEIDTLNMKIYTSTSIEQIESYAMDELKMRYPTSSQCIYIGEDSVLMDNFAASIRKRAYE